MNTLPTNHKAQCKDETLAEIGRDQRDAQGDGLWCSAPGFKSFSIQLLSDLSKSKVQSIGIWSNTSPSPIIHAMLFTESACSGDSVRLTWKGEEQHLSVLPGDRTSPDHVISAKYRGIDPCTFGLYSCSLSGSSIFSLNDFNQDTVGFCSYQSLSRDEKWIVTFRQELTDTASYGSTILVEPVYQVHPCMRLLSHLSCNSTEVLCPQEIAALDLLTNQAQRQEQSESLFFAIC